MIRDKTQTREEFVEEPQTRTAKFAKHRTQALEIVVGGALVIVLEVEQFFLNINGMSLFKSGE